MLVASGRRTDDVAPGRQLDLVPAAEEMHVGLFADGHEQRIQRDRRTPSLRRAPAFAGRSASGSPSAMRTHSRPVILPSFGDANLDTGAARNSNSTPSSTAASTSSLEGGHFGPAAAVDTVTCSQPQPHGDPGRVDGRVAPADDAHAPADFDRLARDSPAEELHGVDHALRRLRSGCPASATCGPRWR